jgi:hypothetical protein
MIFFSSVVFKGKRDGFFVELGLGDFEGLSNTLLLGRNPYLHDLALLAFPVRRFIRWPMLLLFPSVINATLPVRYSYYSCCWSKLLQFMCADLSCIPPCQLVNAVILSVRCLLMLLCLSVSC